MGSTTICKFVEIAEVSFSIFYIDFRVVLGYHYSRIV